MASLGKHLKPNMKYTRLGELNLDLCLGTHYISEAASKVLGNGIRKEMWRNKAQTLHTWQEHALNDGAT